MLCKSISRAKRDLTVSAMLISMQVIFSAENVNQGFTYSYIPPEKEKPELIPAIGKRAEIMFGNKKTAVYRSKDQEDWIEAKRLLEEAGIDFTHAATEEVPVSGCGTKLDPRKFANSEKKEVPKTVYRIEVVNADKDRAAEVLDGKVLPVRSFGLGIQ